MISYVLRVTAVLYLKSNKRKRNSEKQKRKKRQTLLESYLDERMGTFLKCNGTASDPLGPWKYDIYAEMVCGVGTVMDELRSLFLQVNEHEFVLSCQCERRRCDTCI